MVVTLPVPIASNFLNCALEICLSRGTEVVWGNMCDIPCHTLK